MIKTKFGIVDNINAQKDYSKYEPERYSCICIDDNTYITDWWDRLSVMKAYAHHLDNPVLGLARWGVTLIPPESLPAFQDIVLSDPRIKTDDNLSRLATKIQEAIAANNF